MSTAEDRAGTILGNTYRLERLIGVGGMGSVYEASHLRVPRRFAVKLLNPEIAMTQSVLERFQREAEIAGSLGDDHITQVFDFNRAENGTPYMVLELLDGEDLSQRLARGPLGLAETIELMAQVTGALQKAHRADVIHRDLKPSNLFLCRRDRGLHVKVMDFGISKVLHQTGTGTRTGMILGTPNYMAPEQAQGLLHEVDLRSDIFSLGAILYECLSGRMAFAGETPIQAIMNVCQAEPAALTALAWSVPVAVERVVQRALSKRREDRHGSVSELHDDLVRAAQLADPSAYAAGLPTQLAPGGYSSRPNSRGGPGSGLGPGNSGSPGSGVGASWGPRPVTPPTTLRSAPGEVARPASVVQSPRRKSYAVIAGLLVAVVGTGIAVVASRGSDARTAVTRPLPPPPAVVTGPDRAAANTGDAAAKAGAAKADAAKADAAKADAAKADADAKDAAAKADVAAKAASVHVQLEVSPADAIVEVDGRAVTERELDVAPGRELHITARASGYQTMRVTHRADATGAVPLKLSRPKIVPRPKKTDTLVEDKW